jgi:transcriptional regulator with XRE-family HTH domain
VYSRPVEIGRKLRGLREKKRLSQGNIEHKTGLLRCYISRVENGYTVPTVETLEKFAQALDIPLYRFFTDGKKVNAPKLPVTRHDEWQIDGQHRHELSRFAKAIRQMDQRKQNLLLHLAQSMARRRRQGNDHYNRT